MAALIFDVGVAVVVRKNDSILLVREATGRYAGKWGIPKGRVDEEETPLDAALRELKEECGITATIEGLIGMREKYDSNGPAVFLELSLHRHFRSRGRRERPSSCTGSNRT